MTTVDKAKKGKKKKNNKKKKQEAEGEVLERVMDSIEMAGASLDFFESDSETEVVEPSEEEVLEAATTEEEAEITEPTEEETLETQSEEVVEASAEASEESEALDIDEHTENAELMEDPSQEFVDQTQAFSIIESLLFSSDRPLGLGTFKAVFKGTNYKTKEIKKALEEMQSVYADASRGVMLEEINGGWQLRTKVDNMDFLRKLAKARPFKLSGPALEVLAIIAYKQPIVKNEVDQIRGVESGHLVRALMEKHLVSFQGKSELPGKPMQYGTTRKFLEIFGLRNLRELPSLDEIDQLLPDGIGIEEEDEKLSDVTAKMSEDYQGNYSEGEEELGKIEDTLGDIDTSSEFFEEEKRRQKEKRDRDRARDIREAMDVGEEVDAKDQRWLAKYDERIALEAEEAAAAEAAANEAEAMDASDADVVIADGVDAFEAAALEELSEADSSHSEALAEESLDELIPAGDDVTEELSALTEETLIDPEVMATDEAMDAADDTEEEPEL